MGHSNVSMGHDFFYIGVDKGESHDYSSCSLSYHGNTAVSFSTAIAKVIPTRGRRQKDVTTRNPGTGLLLVSKNCMSNCTAKHICSVTSASPFSMARVPLRRGYYDFTPEDVRDGFLEELETLANGLNRIENRRGFVFLMEQRKAIIDKACTTWAKPLRDRRFRKFDKIDVEEMSEELKKRQRELARKKAEKRRKALELFYSRAKNADGAGYCELLRDVFSSSCKDSSAFSYDERKELRPQLDYVGSYVWPDGEWVVTSMGVRVPIKEARVLLKAWASGVDMSARHVGPYTILEYEGDVIRIGCHRIPRRNMLALYEAVIGRPFPKAASRAGSEKGD